MLSLLFCLAVVIVYGITRPPNADIDYGVAVIAIDGDWRYTFQHVDDAGNLIGKDFTEDICRDYASPRGDFLLGIILEELHHVDESGCWSLNPYKHGGYFKRRDKQHRPLFTKGVTVNGSN